MEDENYIDKLYKDSFQSFEIQPKKGLNVKENSKLLNTIEKKSLINKIIGSKLGIGLSIGFILSVIGVLMFVHKNKPKQEEKDLLEPVFTKPTPNEDNVFKDSVVKIQLFEHTETTTETKKNKAKNRNEKAESDSVAQPVIIRKTIIKRDTVVKHKQIIEKGDTTNEK
ncbi:MAG: hypothetical protein WBM13_02020 [Bacteroidia bacterium]